MSSDRILWYAFTGHYGLYVKTRGTLQRACSNRVNGGYCFEVDPDYSTSSGAAKVVT